MNLIGESWAPVPAVRLHLWVSPYNPAQRCATLVKSASQRRNTVPFRSASSVLFVVF